MRNTLTALSAALLAAVAGALPARAQDDPTGAWNPETAGVNFSSGGSATDGTYLYVAGGFQNAPGSFNFPGDFQALRRYDPANDTWVQLDDLPFPVADNAAAFHGGRLFSVGGVNLDTGMVTAQICEYDVATGMWSESSDLLSSPRNRLAAVTMGDLIYVTGGSDSSGNLTDANDEFDPVNGGVQPREPMPAPLNLHGSAALSNRLYVAGGFDFGGPVASTYAYDPSTDSWTNRASLQGPRYAPVALAIAGRMYLTGGFENAPISETWEYNPADDTWARRADMADARHAHGGAAIGGRGYVYGGSGVLAGEEFTAPLFEPEPPANLAPIADAGDDRTVPSTSSSGAAVTLDGAGSSDPDGDALSYTWTGSFGTASGVGPTVSLPVGASVVTLTVSDGALTSSDTVTITVADDAPPVFTQLSASPDTLWSPNNDMRNVTITAVASDDGDPSPTCQVIGVSSNQAQGNEQDWQITGDLTLQLRAERDNGQARVYTVSVRCTDSSGNSTVQTVTVCVPHNQGNGSDAEGASAKKAK
jgi:N-acetylneuraminic acid mutarotase